MSSSTQSPVSYLPMADFQAVSDTKIHRYRNKSVQRDIVCLCIINQRQHAIFKGTVEIGHTRGRDFYLTKTRVVIVGKIVMEVANYIIINCAHRFLAFFLAWVRISLSNETVSLLA